MAPIGAEAGPLTEETQARLAETPKSRPMSPAPPPDPMIVDALVRFAADANAPCSYAAIGLNCLRCSDGADSWSDTLHRMRARTPEPVPHVPCRSCEARLHLLKGPWSRDAAEWHGRAYY